MQLLTLPQFKKTQIFNSILKTADNKTIIIPNGELPNGSLTNYAVEETRRVDWTFGIAYGGDTAKAKEAMLKLMTDNPKIISTEDKTPFLAVSELGDSSVNFVVSPWVKSPDYWKVFFSMIEKIDNTFSKKG